MYVWQEYQARFSVEHACTLHCGLTTPIGLKEHMADPGFGRGGFMHMNTVATTPPFEQRNCKTNKRGFQLNPSGSATVD